MTPADAMKARLRDDLRAAMKARRNDEARLLRTLVAAIDNAEAPPLPDRRAETPDEAFAETSPEIDRLSLTAAQVRAILEAEHREREGAAAEMGRLGRAERAGVLRAEAALVRRYLG